MSRSALIFCATALLLIATPRTGAAKDAGYVDLSQQFTDFFDRTVSMNDATRVAAFRAEMNPLLPGFYEPRGSLDAARYDALVLEAIRSFPALRSRYERVQRDFPAAFAAGIKHFRRTFPGWKPALPVYLLHSLGELDGGTRTLGGKRYLVFGADVIARIHDSSTLTPFLDHELFHVENGKHFPECEWVWCSLWAEGLATYAAETMNPGATDRQLLLTEPAPIRADVDANWRDAICLVHEKLDSTEEADFETLFYGGPRKGKFPRRFGYYVGLRALEDLEGEFSLPELAKMQPEVAKQTLTRALTSLIKKAGGCD